MKSLISLVTIVLLFSLKIFSQPYYDKGTYSLSGSIYYTSSNEETPYHEINNRYFDFSPIASYFFIEKLSLGLELSYNYSDASNSYIEDMYGSGTRQYNSTLSFGPIVRYYFQNQKISPFLEIGYNHLITNLNEHALAGFRARVGFGVDCFLSDAIALEPNIIYELMNTKFEYINYYTTTQVFKIGLKVNYFIH